AVAAVAILKGTDGRSIDGETNDLVRPFLAVGVSHRKGVLRLHSTNVERPQPMLPRTQVDRLPARSTRTLDDLSVTTSGLRLEGNHRRRQRPGYRWLRR